MITATKNKIDRHLAQFLAQAKKDYPFTKVNPLLFNSIKDFCGRPGKRIRPVLTALSYEGYSAKKTPAKGLYTACCAIELLHDFMLIHDDIIDCADLRRGKPTIHKILAKTFPVKTKEKLGNDLAIIAGDIVYALALEAFLAIDEKPERKEAALKYFIRTAGVTALGEFIDILHGFEPIDRVREKDTFLNYSLKTARYTFEAPLVMGALLAGAPKQDLKTLEAIGLSIGQAFQIQDDIIGIFSTEKKIGKSVLSDLAERKKTILTAHAYRTLKRNDLRAFLKIFNKPIKTYRDLTAVRKIFIDSGSLLYSLKKVNSLLQNAHHGLTRLKIAPRSKKILWDIFSEFFRQSEEVTHHVKA